MGNKREYIYERKHIYEADKAYKEKAYEFCEGYKRFLDDAKTEREAVTELIKMAKEKGYKEFDKYQSKLNPGEKYFVNNRERSLVLFTIGQKPLSDGINFNVAHIDCPRIDLKSNPVIERDELAYFKTHYYGGIRKYQWACIPLSMHGVIVKNDGSVLTLKIGEKAGDTQFVITDLLPHLAIEQSERKLKEGIRAEELNILIGSLPIDEEDETVKEKIKTNTLKILYETYGITEKDFTRADIEFVPAFHPSDVGYDRSLIGGYGQDDRVCAYPAFVAETENQNPELTSVTVFTDKEEIGSEGNTGMISNYLFDIVEDMADIKGIKARDIYRHSLCISSDVNAAYDPTFEDVFEKRNASWLNKGIVLTKFTGHAGKADANEAPAEVVAKVIKLFDDNNVIWQAAEFGKVDIGGGGTIAKYISARNVDTIDSGVAVLSMHSPFEITSKLDIYHTYLAYKAFLLNK